MVFATDLEPTETSPHRSGGSHRVANDRVANDRVANNVEAGHSSIVKSVQPKADEVAIAPRGLSPHSLSRASQPTPLPLPVKPTLPLGLKILNYVQQGSTVITSLLIGGALVLYGSSVYVDKSADRVTTRLNQLQGESQQLTSANESIKQSLAEQAAQAGSGLEPYEAGDVLFVAPEPARETDKLLEAHTERPKPLGY